MIISYIDCDYYKNNYLCGKKAVIDTAFDFYSRESSAVLSKYINGEIGDNIDEVKLCCCEIAELLYKASNSHNSQSIGLKSEKVGDYSVEYEDESNKQDAVNREIRSIIYKWLAKTGLLYRGVR